MTADPDESLAALFDAFLEEPTEERFLALRDVLANSPRYDPYGSGLDETWELLEARQFEAARDSLVGLMPNWLLSPRAHTVLSFVHSKLGDRESASAEMQLSNSLLEAMRSTGDGSEERPYLVLHTSDEYDLLEHLGKTSRQQSLIRKDNGRSYDAQECSNGEVVWFDVSAMMATLSRRTSTWS